MSLKRYLVFGWDQHYPTGGMNDFIGSYDDEYDANMTGRLSVISGGKDRYQVWDTVDNCQVESGRSEDFE